MMIGALALLFATSPKLAALIVLGVPATLIPILIMGRRVRRLSRLNQDRVGDVSAYVDESIHEIRTVQAYRHEDRAREHFSKAAAEACAAGVHRIRVKAWLISLVMLIAFCAVGVILWELWSGRRLHSGDNEAELMHRVRDARVPLLSMVAPDLPDYAGQVARKALFADRARRFQTAAEFIKALEALANRSGWPLTVEALQPLLGG